MDLSLTGIPLRGSPPKRSLRRAPDYENNWNKDYPIPNPPKLFNYKPAAAHHHHPRDGSESYTSSAFNQYSSRSHSPSQSSDPNTIQEGHENASKAAANRTKSGPTEIPNTKNKYIAESCHNALSTLEDLGVQSLSHMLDDYHINLQSNQQQKSLAARAEYLKQQLYGEINDHERNLAPHSFGWQETPWSLDHPAPGQEYAWIGETNSTPNNAMESPQEARMWETLRHAEARAFPLENEEVVRNLFEGLERAMTADDVDSVSRQWQERDHFEHQPARDDSPEPEIFKKYNVSSKKKVEFGKSVVQTRSGNHKESDSDDQGSSDGASSSEDTGTLFSPSQEQTPYGTPYHDRSRSIDPDQYIPPTPKEKSISQRRLESELAAKKAREEIELNSKFRATPVPASSILPRYDAIMRKMGNKSTAKRNERSNEIMSNVKPFSFSCKADHSGSQSSLAHCKCKSQSNKFIQDMLLEIEKEEASKKRVLFLHNAKSSLASHAAEDGRKKREALLANEKRAGISKNHTYRPKLNHTVPDFKTLQSDFERKLESAKSVKSKLTVDPFPGLEEHTRLAEKKKHDRQKQHVKQMSKFLQRAEFKATSMQSIDSDAPPPLPFQWRETKSSVLKMLATEEKINALEANEEEKAEVVTIHQHGTKEKEMIAKIQLRSERAQSAKLQRSDALKQALISEERTRVREYKKQLKRMNEKLENRLCLFELVSIENAKRRARMQVEQILRNQKF
ncbi:hypothetical protein HDU98_006379 [Podochytrium sp. JEL0797]|nr:hypothetical protein HDU98_006379 [Podochytrium sp. JEL0797]